MKLINPIVTVENTDDVFWLVTYRQEIPELERLDFTLLIPKSSKSLGQIQVDVMERARELLGEILKKARTAA